MQTPVPVAADISPLATAHTAHPPSMLAVKMARQPARTRFAWRAFVALACVLCTACSHGTEPNPTPGQAASRALDYLQTTRDEMGLDVVFAVQVYGRLSGDPRAERVATRLRKRLRPRDLERYGHLLDIDTPAFPRLSVRGSKPSASVPDPGAALDDDRVQRCPLEVLDCRIDESCRSFVGMNDQWGKVLTHQALWLLFAKWSGCQTGIDLDERRRTFAVNLLEAMRADHEPSDLAIERLAMLAHLGFATEIDPAWIDELLAAQQPEGCFPASATIRCHPHPTGLALWVLGHVIASARVPRR